MQTWSIAIFSVALLGCTAKVAYAGECVSISEIACSKTDFSMLCSAITEADLKMTLESSGFFTVFAPTNEAFNALPPDTLDSILQDKEQLTDLLLFHVFEGEYYKEDLWCTHLLEMANGRDSRTVCRKDMVYQKGAGNLEDKMPEIILPDVEACNGVVHAVNHVMLPKPLVEPAQAQCSTIAEIACGTDGFSMLCEAVKTAGLDEALGARDGEYTVFAPTDVAFGNLPEGLYDSLLTENPSMLSDLLLYHTVQGEVLSTDLACRHLVLMMNGKNSRTVCRGGQIYQKGGGNTNDRKPQIMATDIEACNGVVHVISEVMLPPAEECYSITEIACGSEDFTSLCTAIKTAGLADILDGDEKFTVFAPNDQAFNRLPDGMLEDLLKDPDALTYVLLFHAISGEVYSSDLECTQLATMLNDEDSRTVCRDDLVYQKGGGNFDDEMPEIVAIDIEACNGVVHVVDQVMLPPP